MRCVIITGGTVENLQWLSEFIDAKDRVICVDGGARYAAALELIPDIIIGDMDSLDHKELDRLVGLGAAVREYPPDKDDTDTALAMAEALSGSPEEIIIVGALGTRFDHSLANVHLLCVALDRGVKARIINEYNEISLVSPHASALLDGRPGDLFSLLPLTEQVTGVNVKGVRWPLENATFRIGNPYGVSNRLAEGKVDISVSSGLLLLIRTSGGLKYGK
ncbi:MAG: thiamine diphosphokinase [Desulfotomaculaceae bacterium]